MSWRRRKASFLEEEAECALARADKRGGGGGAKQTRLPRAGVAQVDTFTPRHHHHQIKWLDRMLLSRADQVQLEVEGHGGSSSISAAPSRSGPANALDTWSSIYVDVELPVFPFPVLHEERRCVGSVGPRNVPA